MKYSQVIYAALLVVCLMGGFGSGELQDRMAGVCVLGLMYVAGATHGLYLGLSHDRRINRYVLRSVDRFIASQEKEIAP